MCISKNTSVYILFLYIFFTLEWAYSNNTSVPFHLKIFGDVKLHITEDARKEIQDQIEALLLSEKYLKIKIDRMNAYFPIIERILKEEGVPDDYKYLCVQESALISDAVSSANAVGYWQFKEATGRENGLRIDDWVDERMNIVSSTKSACRYLKSHNKSFDNWVYSTIAYNTGKTGAEKYVDKKKFGATTMNIDKNTHWYFKTFLAHKIAFEKELKKDHRRSIVLNEYKKTQGKKIEKIAQEQGITIELLTTYNKWLKKKEIPTDKEYTIIIPSLQKSTIIEEENLVYEEFVSLKENITFYHTSLSVKINSIPAVIADKNQSISDFLQNSNISPKKFIQYNDIEETESIQKNQTYYLQHKKRKAITFFHTLQEHETLWLISQKYGIKLKHLLKKNRIRENEKPIAGRIVWLRKIRPLNIPIEYDSTSIPKKPNNPIKQISIPENIQQKIDTISTIIQTVTDTLHKITPLVQQIIDTTSSLPTNIRNNTEKITDTIINITTRYIENIPQISTDSILNTHTVVAGETLYSLSKKYKISIEDLLKYNNITNTISINQQIKIPNIPSEWKQNTISYPSTHQVIKGETMHSIAKKYNTTPEAIMKLNNKANTNINIKEILKIPK